MIAPVFVVVVVFVVFVVVVVVVVVVLVLVLVLAGYARTCADILAKISSLSHIPGFKAKIDPDGPGGVHPFHVSCTWSSTQKTMQTIAHHNKEGRTRVQGYEAPASYRAGLVYKGATLQQVVALVSASTKCKQLIKYECKGSMLYSNYGFWRNRAHKKMLHWGGVQDRSQTKMTCACHSTRSCAGKHNCNCDVNDRTWRVDEGYLTDKNNLPITEVCFGDTGNTGEEGYHTVGPLICTV